jgi:hypothetical protein
MLQLDIAVKHEDEEWGTSSVEVELYRPSVIVIREEPSVGGECFSPHVNTPPPFFIDRQLMYLPPFPAQLLLWRS